MLFLFVDGLGLAPAGADNPVNDALCPTLNRFIREQGHPIDACLDVPGLPQSATGQAALFTGINAARRMGRHVEGFPGPSLRALVAADNIFLTLTRRGHHCRFADAFLADTIEEIRARRFQSVTTTAALTCPEVICLRPDLLANQAVCHDITRETLAARGYHGPTLAPQVAAEQLVQIALSFDFTLYEYFQTDRAGHTGDPSAVAGVLGLLDRFLERIWSLARETGLLLVLTSDHGNIECACSQGHTRNPVPLAAIGPGAESLRDTASLLDITPALVRLLG